MPELTVASGLREAARLIREHGLAQGSYTGPGGVLCAKGAICRAFAVSFGAGDGTFTDSPVSRALAAVRSLVPAASALGYDALVVWNDTPGRTGQEVAAMLEAAADQEEQRAQATSDTSGQGEDHHDGGD